MNMIFMTSIKRVSVKLRLTLGYTAITLLLVLVAGMGIWGEAATQKNLDNQIYHINQLSQMGNELLDAVNARAVSARNLVIASSEEDRTLEARRVLEA